MQSSIASSGHKVMIIGIDGCSLCVIERLISEGYLPNFAKLLKNGVAGKLRSTTPPASPSAWTTLQTGKDPGKHGIFDFFRNRAGAEGYDPVNSTFVKSETFWQRLSGAGKKIGVVNFLFTYPPRPVNGFIVTGKETPSEDVQYTYPESLKGEILDRFPKYKVEPFKRISQSEVFLRNVPGKLAVQETVNSYLLKQYPSDLFMNMFSMPDVIQHVFWRHMDPDHPRHDKTEAKRYYPLIVKVFSKLDEIIGSRLESIDDDTTLVVLSDHGGCGVNRVVQMNQWLRMNGFLFLNENALSSRGISRILWRQIREFDRFLGRLDVFGLRRWLKYRTREKRRLYSMGSMVDWSRTMAYAGRPSESGIYCNLRGREKNGIVSPGKQYEELRQQLIDSLLQIRDPENGNKIFKNVRRREEIFDGPYVKYAPDILWETGDLPYQEGDKFLCDSFFEDVTGDDLTGKHHPEGILIVYGSGIKKGAVVQGAHLRDIAPTVLYMMGEKVPADMDGKVLLNLFAEDIVDTRPVVFDEEGIFKDVDDELIYDSEQTAEVEKRLKDLGYL